MEMNIGELEGLPNAIEINGASIQTFLHYAQNAGYGYDNYQQYVPQGGESLDMVSKRTEVFLHKVISKFIEKNDDLTPQNSCCKVLAVTHGGFIRRFKEHFNIEHETKNVSNCSLNVYDIKLNDYAV